MLTITSLIPRELDEDLVLKFVKEVFFWRGGGLKKSLKGDDDARLLSAHFIISLTVEEKFLIEGKFEEEIKEKASNFHKAVVEGNVYIL